jgi:integrase
MATVRKRTWGEGREAFILTYTDSAGKRRQETFKSKKAADARRREVEHEMDIGVHVAKGETVTVNEAIDAYVEDCWRQQRLGDLVKATVKVRSYQLNKHVRQSLGALRLADIDSAILQKFIDKQREAYAAATVRHIHNTLYSLLDFGVGNKWLKRNIMRDEPLKLPSTSQRAKVPTIADIKRLLEVVWEFDGGENLLSNVNRCVAIHLGVFGGLRPGEVFGLQWENVDFAKGVIHVRHSYTKADGLKQPKTEAGVREVILVDPIIDALENLVRYKRALRLAEQHEYRPYKGKTRTVHRKIITARAQRNFDRSAGAEVELKGHVIVNKYGEPYAATAMNNFFGKVMRRAGLVDQTGGIKFTMHALRHAHASLLLQSRLPLHNIKRQLGHASAQTTIDIYGHVFPEDEQTRTVATGIATELGATRMRQALPKPLN